MTSKVERLEALNHSLRNGTMKIQELLREVERELREMNLSLTEYMDDIQEEIMRELRRKHELKKKTK